MVVIRAARILHGHADRMFTGMLALGDGRNINADKLTHVPRQGCRRTTAGFFGDGEQRVAVDQWLFTTLDDGLECGQQGSNTGFVVQVPGADMAAFGELGQRVKGDKIPNIDPQ